MITLSVPHKICYIVIVHHWYHHHYPCTMQSYWWSSWVSSVYDATKWELWDKWLKSLKQILLVPPCFQIFNQKSKSFVIVCMFSLPPEEKRRKQESLEISVLNFCKLSQIAGLAPLCINYTPRKAAWPRGSQSWQSNAVRCSLISIILHCTLQFALFWCDASVLLDKYSSEKYDASQN